jgi:glycosyltransferase involved in cell wall biosynthesis
MNIIKEFKKGCSIIIPVWNSEATLKRCLNSIPSAFPQETPLELLIIDKGSTDTTFGIIAEFMDKHPTIDTHVLIEVGALGAARLKGIDNSKYPTIFWLDSDIILPAHYIDKLFEMFSKYPNKEKAVQLQGRMHGTGNLAFRWWAGCGIATRRKNKVNYVVAINGATANALVIKSTLKMTKAEREYLKKLHSTEDSFLSSVVQSKGYCQLMFPIDTIHLVREVCDTEGSHKIVWSLVGLKDRGYGKLNALWHMKFIWRNGFYAFLEYRTLDLVIYTVKLWLNLVRACLKDKRIINQRRLTTLKEW